MIEGATLSDARAALMGKIDQGADCPCCGQFAKRYKRKFNSTMAHFLIWLVGEYQENGRDWVDVNLRVERGGDHAKAKHWGLIYERENQNPKTRTSGLWKPTDKGIRFVFDQCQIPAHVYLYDNIVQGFSDDQIGIRDAVGRGFDYRELMNAISRPADIDTNQRALF